MGQPTDYELYLRVPELLALQKKPGELACHDELLFQVVHQAAELWMKLVAHDLALAGSLISAARLTEAAKTLRRTHQVLGLLSQSLETLYTLSPLDYMRIREVLGRGSGQESPGYRRLLALPGQIFPHFEALLEQQALSLFQVYSKPGQHPEFFQIAEALLEFDLRLQEWRNRHILLVYRTIGVGTPSLKGKHSELLEKSLRQQFFPQLWKVRDELFSSWSLAHPTGATETLASSKTPDPTTSPDRPDVKT